MSIEVIITTVLLLVFFAFSLWITIRAQNRLRLIFLPVAILLLIIREIVAISRGMGMDFLTFKSDPFILLFILLMAVGLIVLFSNYSFFHLGTNALTINDHSFINNYVQKLENGKTKDEIFERLYEGLKSFLGEVPVAFYTRHGNGNMKLVLHNQGNSCKDVPLSLKDDMPEKTFMSIKKWTSNSRVVMLKKSQAAELELEDFLHAQEEGKHYIYLAVLKVNGEIDSIAFVFSCKKVVNSPLHTIKLLSSLASARIANIKTQQQALFETNKYNTILDSINYLIGYKDDKSRWKFLNKAASDFLGLKQDDYLYRTNYELQKISKFHYDVFSFFELNEIKCWQENKTIVEKKTIKTYAADKLFEISFVPAYASRAYQNATIIVARDVTEQETTYDALKTSEREFRELITHMPLALAILSGKNYLEYVNQQFTDTYGYKLSEVSDLNDWFVKAYPDPAYRERVLRDWRYSVKVKDPRHLYKVFSVRTKQGNFIRTRFRWGYIGNEKIFIIMENITKEQVSRRRDKQTQRNLIRLSRSALELITLPSQERIFEYIGNEIISFFKGAIVLFNMIDKDSKYAYMHRHFGISDDKAGMLLDEIGRDPYHYFFGLKPYLKLVMLKGKLTTVKKRLHPLLEGDFSVESINRMERILGGNYLYVIGLVRNGIVYGNMMLITKNKVQANSFNFVETFMHQASIAFHQKELEKELIRAKERAEESDKLKSAFLANMSHEVRTPMNSIVGFSELLSNPDYSEEEKSKFVELINDNSRQLMKLITDIVDISKIEAGQISLEYTQVNINRMMDNLHSSFKNDIAKREKAHLTLKVHKDVEDPDFLILMDEYRLKQILMNLINNAIKFTNKGYIEFGYKKQSEDKILFFVRDTGLGIDPMNKEIIFERFRQGADNEIVKNSGTGLGLSISRGLVELMKGTIWFDSLKFKGTTFYFVLPLEEVRMKKIEPNKEAPIIIDDWEEKSVLIVEDHQPSYLYMKRILEKSSIIVEYAESANKAVENVQDGAFYDLILMDIRTPDGSGIDATRKIKSLNPDMQIVAQTAYAMQEDRQRCLDAGCDDYLIKPFTKDQLLSILDKFL